MSSLTKLDMSIAKLGLTRVTNYSIRMPASFCSSRQQEKKVPSKVCCVEQFFLGTAEHKRPELIERNLLSKMKHHSLKYSLGIRVKLNQITMHKVLRLTWNVVKDEVVLDFEKLISVVETMTFMKRNLLRLTTAGCGETQISQPKIIFK